MSCSQISGINYAVNVAVAMFDDSLITLTCYVNQGYEHNAGYLALIRLGTGLGGSDVSLVVTTIPSNQSQNHSNNPMLPNDVSKPKQVVQF